MLGPDVGQYDKATDVMDVWFDSGVVHHCLSQSRPEITVPADLYLEGSDQHRGWFHSSLLTSVAMHGRAPYRGVLTHGFTVDEKGRKMSKSIGNTLVPQKLTEHSGRGCGASVGGGDRLRQRNERVGRNLEAHGGFLPPHPQYPAVSAGEHAWLRSQAARRGVR